MCLKMGVLPGIIIIFTCLYVYTCIIHKCIFVGACLKYLISKCVYSFFVAALFLKKGLKSPEYRFLLYILLIDNDANKSRAMVANPLRKQYSAGNNSTL